MRARFDVEHAQLLRESEAEWLRQSAARIRAAHHGESRKRELRPTREVAR